MTGQHDERNAVPSLDGTELGYVLDQLAGRDPGIDLIRDGLRLIALSRHTTDRTQVLNAALAGDPDAIDILGALALTVERLNDSHTNPALRHLPFDQQEDARIQGKTTARDLLDRNLREAPARANHALDH